MGLGWEVGTLVATFAMAGDLFSSFVKRRLHLPSAAWPWEGLGPQPGGNVREANSDRRKEAMCAVV